MAEAILTRPASVMITASLVRAEAHLSRMQIEDLGQGKQATFGVGLES